MSNHKINNKDIAKLLSSALFDAGEDCGARPHRIGFKGGKYPGDEIDMGGFSEAALCRFIENKLSEF